MKKALCEAFCNGIVISDVPVGLAVGTMFKRGSESISFFIVYKAGDRSQARLEDDGLTIAFLQDAGIDIFKAPRAVLLANLLKQFNVYASQDESLFYTDYYPIEQIASNAIPFIDFLVRVQEFSLWTRDRVEETFKADILEAITKRMSDRAVVVANEPPARDLNDYIADIVVRPEGSLPPLAIYVGTSETKALEALVFYQAAELAGVACHVVLVVKSLDYKRIKGRTFSRAAQSFPIVAYSGNESEALEKIDQQAFSPPPTRDPIFSARSLH